MPYPLSGMNPGTGPVQQNPSVYDLLAARGWKKDSQRFGMISPDGHHFVADTTLRLLTYDAASAMAEAAAVRPKWTTHEKLTMRLNVESLSLDHVHIVEGANQVHIFLVHGDQALIVSDDKNLFPSDTCVAKVKLFMEAVL